MEALSSAVTGLGTFQQALNVVGSNLANVSTPGYKATTISFQELIASVSRPASGPTSTLGGINPHQSVQGVKVGQENAKYTQGSLTPTGKPTDLGITGDGFFVLRQVNGNLAYTRNGNFSIDKTGLFVNASGFPVMGWTADATGNVDTAQPVGKLTIPLGLSKSLVTKNISYGGVLDGSTPPPGTANGSFTAGALDSAAAAGAVVNSPNVDWVDNNGTKHTVSYTFTKVTNNAGLDDVWNMTVNGLTAGGAWTGTNTNATAIPITFDAAGKVSLVNGVAGQTLSVGVGETVEGTQNVGLDLSTLTSSAVAVQPASKADGTVGGPLLSTVTGQIFDSLGTSHQLVLTYQKVVPSAGAGGAEWIYTATVDGDASTSTGKLFFDNHGVYDKALSTANPQVAYQPSNGSELLNMTLDFSHITNQAVATVANVVQKSQDGTPPGTLTSIGVDTDGTINGSFTNGLQIHLGRVALATFPNVQGLVGLGDGMLTQSAASGSPAYTGNNVITAGSLENSNVDIGAEFTNMIVAQRAFQANSKMVTVIDQVLADIANLKN